MKNVNLTTEAVKEETANLNDLMAMVKLLPPKEQEQFYKAMDIDSTAFKNRKTESIKDLKTYLENEIFNAVEIARATIQQNFESNVWASNCIDTTKMNIHIGVNLNPKVKTNKDDKLLRVKASLRTHTETEQAEADAKKDKAETIKLTSYKHKNTHKNSKK